MASRNKIPARRAARPEARRNTLNPVVPMAFFCRQVRTANSMTRPQAHKTAAATAPEW